MKGTAPVVITAMAIQSLIEAVQVLERKLDAQHAADVEKPVQQARQAGVALNQWIEEQRG